MVHISEALRELLVRDGMSAGSAGTDRAQGKGAGLPFEGGKTDPLTAQAKREVTREPILVWNNPHMTKTAGRRTSRAVLVICE